MLKTGYLWIIAVAAVVFNGVAVAGEHQYVCTVKTQQAPNEKGELVPNKTNSPLGKTFTINRENGLLIGEVYSFEYDRHEILRVDKFTRLKPTPIDSSFLYTQRSTGGLGAAVMIDIWDPGTPKKPITFTSMSGLTVLSGTCE